MRILIPSEGSLSAKIALVGEAPGQFEEKVGKPFVGPAGHMLDECLNAAKLNRSSCYITNVVKERPANNDISLFLKLSPTSVKMTPAYKAYEDSLKDELERSTANVIVALGGIALFALTRKIGILKYRGSTLESTLLPGRKVIPTIHPSAVMREKRMSGTATYQLITIADLEKVGRESVTPFINCPRRELILAPTYDQVMNFLAGLSPEICKEVAFDIEVIRGEVSCISFATSPEQSICIAFSEGLKNRYSLEEETNIWLLITKILENKDIKKIGQNITGFDNYFLYSKYGILPANLEDTMVAHGILYPDLPKGLDFLTSIYTNEPYYKDEGKQYIKIGGNDRDFWRYNALDSAVCIEVWKSLERELKEQDMWKMYRNKISLTNTTIFLQYHGIGIDRRLIDEAIREVDTSVAELTQKLKTQVGFDINPGSHKQLKEYFYGVLGIDPYKSRTTHNTTVDKDALKRLARGTQSRPGRPVAATILEIRRLNKFKDTYLEMNIDDDNQVRGSYNLVGTGDGRLSSSQTIFGTGGNMQNLDPRFKNMMHPDEGCYLYSMDLKQSHDVTIANISNDEMTIEAIERNLDLHKIAASAIFNKPYEAISDEPGSAAIGSGQFSERFWGKKARHCLKYGMGFRSFANLCEIQEHESQKIVRAFYISTPGIIPYW
ncbi:MAG: hypothetical protein EHM79_00170, partial [Geobacter sp.]